MMELIFDNLLRDSLEGLMPMVLEAQLFFFGSNSAPRVAEVHG